MKNLGKAIDLLIQIDSDFEKKLKLIKNKWRRWPNNSTKYWTELLEFLNADSLMTHPRRDQIRNAINTKKKNKRKLYSFETLLQNDRVIGNIPGNMADKIRRQDRRSIEIAKLRIEADLTRNTDLMAELIRKDHILEIETKKMWVSLRDHFNLWKQPGSYNIRSKDGVLFLVMPQLSSPPQYIKPGVIKVDSTMLRNFFRYMGIDPSDIES